MTLKNNLYRIISADAAENRYELELIPDNVIYRAHFPNQPITPGVCIVQIASELLEESLSENLQLIAVNNAKFLAVINPTETKFINYTFKKIVPDAEQGEVKVSVVVDYGDVTYTKLSLNYRIK